jgi:hypothetical protein
MVLQQSTQELWASQGPFEPYTIHRIPHCNIPEIYVKSAVWRTDTTPARYYAQSTAPEESGLGTWFPLEFNEEHVCWVEVCWQEPAGSEGYWQAFRIAGEDLGVDITQGDVEFHLQNTTLTNYQESIASSHSSRANTPSSPSIIIPRPSPHLPGSRDQEIANTLAESLHIDKPMSNTLTMEVPAGTINPHTGHVDANNAALYRAIGPDHPDPPSMGGTEHTTRVPFRWLRPPGGGPPEARRYIYGGGPRGPPAGPFMGYPHYRGGPLGGGLPRGGPPRGGPPGGGPPGGGPPMPLPPAPVIPGGRNDKLVGNTPLIFTGDRVTFLPNYLILSHYLTAYHWDCLSFILSPIPSTVRALYHPVTCLSGLVTFYNILQHSITNTGTTSISGTTTNTLSISGFPSTTTSSIRLALCTI